MANLNKRLIGDKMATSFCSERELKVIGLRSYGKNVLVSKKASLVNPELLTIGNNVRIDDYSILTGNVNIGSYVHIAAYCALYGRFGIEINDFCSTSAKVIIYSASDDFSGEFLAGPTIPSKFTRVQGGKVILKKYVLVGAGSIIFPNIVLEEGVCVGAMSLVNRNLDAWGIYAGIPARFVKRRSRGLLRKARSLE
jgi:acetyltransferase-like isoleucine patch superfamily enzyme